MDLPRVMDERATLDAALAGKSLARYGDGEFKLCLGHDCVSQRASEDLADDLRAVLHADDPNLLVCIPNLHHNAKPDSWANYGAAKYMALLEPGREYGSAFITRPDSAPWIDTPDYWADVERLWLGKDVTLVCGTDRSLREDMLTGAASVRMIRDEVSHRDAYERIDEIEERIGTPSGPVLLCLGPCATVLAALLSDKGVHALDLGHIGMFMRHAGAYRYGIDELASHGYRQQLRSLHGRPEGWGGDGAKHLQEVLAYADQIDAKTVLDYGCGEGALSEAAKPFRRILNYDPGMTGRDGLPKPVDLVVCTDVLEHVEPEKLDNVLGHIGHLAAKAAFVVISTRPANAVLPDGRNAHLLVRPAEWWIDRLVAGGWTVEKADGKEGKEVRAWLRKAA